MVNEAKVLRFPVPEERVTCRLRVPRFGDTIAECEDVPSGLSALAIKMQRVAENFDEVAQIFDECDEATYCGQTCYVDGLLTFEFYVPRRFLPRLRELGWEPEEEA